MKLKQLSLFSLMLAGALMLVSMTAYAQESTMTDAHIQRIQANCQQADANLAQVHVSDALLRVNRGELYDLISTRLMGPMNSRLTANHLDASKLTSITASFNNSLDDFRSEYQAYEEQLSATLQIDCTTQPVEFYDAVAKSRELRAEVAATVNDLSQYISQYGQSFDTLRSNFGQPKADAS